MPRLTPEFIPPRQLTDDDISPLLDIARRQAALRDELKAAFIACDDLKALNCARALVGFQVREQ